ncbi:MAG: GNAT family N-acetyltransferase [Flavobacteriales bacterium]|nr:GNAT family N-acetyltransferase [Flavobacteriales bacterium]
MKEQIIQLFSEQYNVPFGAFEKTFNNFYEHPFQASKCIRLVAIRDKEVLGFQSFFYWPCSFKGKQYQVFQSGNSLVSPAARGKGVFGRLLAYVFENKDKLKYDLLIGFPVEMSFGSFMRKNWEHPFDLRWYVKIGSPIRSLLGNPEKAMAKRFSSKPSRFIDSSSERFQVDYSEPFFNYRDAYSDGSYFFFEFEADGKSALFVLKIQTRKKVIRECIIGKVIADSYEETFLQSAFRALIKEIRKSGAATLISIAFNPLDKQLKSATEKLGFRKLERIIRFIYYGDLPNELKAYDQWAMFRADIDTW